MTTNEAWFDGCTSLTKITYNGYTGDKNFALPNTVKNLSFYLFRGTKIDYADISWISGNNNLRSYIFENCTELKQVVLCPDLTYIPYAMFSGCSSLTEITIPDGVTIINMYAFANTGLTKVTIPSRVNTIKAYAFANVGITQIALPERLTTMEANAFRGTKIRSLDLSKFELSTFAKGTFQECEDLEEVILNSNWTKIPSYFFYGCTSLQRFELPISITEIGDYAFANCSSLTELEMAGTGLTSIGKCAFVGSALTKATVPSIVIKIGDGAFNTASLTQLTVDEKNKDFSVQNGFLVNKDGEIVSYFGKLSDVNFDGFDKIPAGFFSGREITSLTVPASVKTIGDGAFENCVIDTITFQTGSMLETIGAKAFLNSTLKSIDLPASTKSIGNSAFENCSALTSVTGAGSATFGTNAFKNCVNLTSFTLPDTITAIPEGMFANSGLTSIVIPASVTEIGKEAFANCAKLATVTFEKDSNLTVVGMSAFENSGLTSVAIPASVQTLSTYCFRNCKDLTTVTFADSEETLSLGVSAFANCTGVKEIVLPSNVIILESGIGRAQNVFEGWTAQQTIRVKAERREFCGMFVRLFFMGGFWDGGCNAKIVYEYVAE